MHTSESKVLLAKLFTEQMSRRLLHAGATTSELLGIYISVISAFKVLDPRGVLLDKVATPLRSYLRQREDSVRIIAASFLADVDEDGNVINPSDDLCKELAREIALSEGQDLQTADVGLDWDDMEWVPDPIDAGPGKSAITIGLHLIFSQSTANTILFQTTRSPRVKILSLSCSPFSSRLISSKKCKQCSVNVY